jgi:hypothetical protein
MSKAAKIIFALVICFGAETDAVLAQSQQTLAQAGLMPEPTARLLRGRNIAPTGETLPHPGMSQIGDETAQEKGAEAQSDRDMYSICSNCGLIR